MVAERLKIEVTTVKSVTVDKEKYDQTVTCPVDCRVLQVFVHDDMTVQRGQPMFQMEVKKPPLITLSEWKKSDLKRFLDECDLPGTYPTFEVPLDQNAENNTPMAAGFDDNVAVEERYRSFKKFDTVVDHSDHLFSTHPSPSNRKKKPSPDWVNNIRDEWRIVQEHLPDTISVRVYESRMDILRAAIIGPQGTPYQDGIFFFDVFLKSSYPFSKPLVRYRSNGISINPHMTKSGEVALMLFGTAGIREEFWVPGTSNLLQLLVYIHDLLLNSKPYFHRLGCSDLRGSVTGDHYCLLYNENVIVKSLKTMVYTLKDPPKHFEDLVVGHFRKHVHDIFISCDAYVKGLQVGCLVSNRNETCSIQFRNDVASCITALVNAFCKIGAKEAQEYLYLGEKITPLPAHALWIPEAENDPDPSHLWTMIARMTYQVNKLLVKEGMEVRRGDSLFAIGKMTYEEVPFGLPCCETTAKSPIKLTLEENQSSRVGIFSMEEMFANESDGQSSLMAVLDLERYNKIFKRFDYVKDHSDHFFSAMEIIKTHVPPRDWVKKKILAGCSTGMSMPEDWVNKKIFADCSTRMSMPEDWVNKIRAEWKILEDCLPGNIFVRVYEPRIDLLRAMIIGPEGTPYHHGLFFIDVHFPITYPKSPPLVHYHSGGLAINPNLDKCGKVCLSLPRTSGGHDSLWMPGTTMLQLLDSIQKRLLNTMPLFNERTWSYNENTFIKSLKSMVYIMNNPPKGFELFVFGHFRNCAADILNACNNDETHTTTFKDLDSCVESLVAAFRRIGACKGN